MKIYDHSKAAEDSLDWTILRIIHTVLNSTEGMHLVEGKQCAGPLRHGYHSHEAWELFCPLQGKLIFEASGKPAVAYDTGTLVIVPPNCLHMTVKHLAQDRDLTVVTMNLPGDEAAYGTLSVSSSNGDNRSALSARELSRWETLLQARPATIMTQVETALKTGSWGKERALGWLRLLFCSYAEIVDNGTCGHHGHGQRCVTQALALIQTHYFDADLSVTSIASQVGLSESHLSTLFRQTTGHTIHQLLIDIRMRRATELLTDTHHSIKEIAALTGWKNQLYFSAAYRRFHGIPPSTMRRREQAQTSNSLGQ
ncbi:MAG: AraC family transcriptional regulator [Candidatus Pacebacteria bacterium]|nr:AraC family transcriptional regulator [Candidatus Paceibacterota bacterium]